MGSKGYVSSVLHKLIVSLSFDSTVMANSVYKKLKNSVTASDCPQVSLDLISLLVLMENYIIFYNSQVN